MAITPDFWQGRRVLITGHTGFKGSWLSLWLQELGAELTGFSLDLPSNPCLFEAARVETGMQSITGDVRDLGQLQHCLRTHEPEIVIHMAAQSLVRRSYRDPIETYATNIMGTVHLLEAVRRTSSVGAVLVVTSDKCYENREQEHGYREDEPMGGFDPYSSSKGCAEIVTAAYRNSYFGDGQHVSVATARGGNVIGGGDWSEDRLIPDAVSALARGDAVAIRNPDAIRPWQHVLDPLNGYLMLAQELWQDGSRFSGAWNFGANDDGAKPVSWIIERVTAQWGGGADWTIESTPQPHEAQLLKLDCTKAKANLGWTPKLDVATAVDWAIDWYKAYQRKERDMREVTREHITRFEEVG